MQQEYEIGMVGLGVMGRNLLLNMADRGYRVAGYDRDARQLEALRAEAQGQDIFGAETLEEMVRALRTPRAVMTMVPAGPPVDAVIRDLLPFLSPGDLIIDGGNSHFKDTELRAKTLEGGEIAFLGMGVSGGEEGARRGPSLMPGGPEAAYEQVRPVMEAIAARADGEPCVAYLGPGFTGHYVKMAHNGIEYGLMQLIAESYDLMKRGLGLSDDALHDIYAEWNRGELESFLLEITADIFLYVDERTGKRLIDLILDVARQKGTGMWASQDAMDLQAPVPTIDTAVSARHLSGLEEERIRASEIYARPIRFAGDRDTFLGQLRQALYAGFMLTFAQGMALLQAASHIYGFGLKLEEVARIWRGGCIIRSALLNDIRSAFRARPDLPNLLLDAHIAGKLAARDEALRSAVCQATAAGIPVPAMAASLAYLDGYRSKCLSANLIQAQRDYFGAHTYERVDAKGVFHTRWTEEA
ncbi:MAG: NADP-dependent phosphogluconate dehydrogenase [Armatimonadetes bacterium]|nr:NADP-dependent phosphogluconate dehydrogenase [Armatimonadota bacterium]